MTTRVVVVLLPDQCVCIVVTKVCFLWSYSISQPFLEHYH